MRKRDVKEMAPPRETRISDLGLAAFLLAQDYDLIRTDETSSRTDFVFANVPEEALFSFYKGDALVNARKVLAAFRDLKGLLLQHGRRRR